MLSRESLLDSVDMELLRGRMISTMKYYVGIATGIVVTTYYIIPIWLREISSDY